MVNAKIYVLCVLRLAMVMPAEIHDGHISRPDTTNMKILSAVSVETSDDETEEVSLDNLDEAVERFEYPAKNGTHEAVMYDGTREGRDLGPGKKRRNCRKICRCVSYEDSTRGRPRERSTTTKRPDRPAGKTYLNQPGFHFFP